jgi:hypothetical protein
MVTEATDIVLFKTQLKGVALSKTTSSEGPGIPAPVAPDDIVQLAVVFQSLDVPPTQKYCEAFAMVA